MRDRVTLFFEPEDVLLFRDHLPFDMGRHVLARSTFPQPTVFRGAVRTALFRQFGARFSLKDEHFGLKQEWIKAVVGGRKEPGSLTLRGPSLARKTEEAVEPLFRRPLDLVCAKDKKTWQVLEPSCFGQLREDLRPQRWHRSSHRNGVTRTEGEVPWSRKELDKGQGEKLLTRRGAEAYLAGDLDQLELLEENEVYQLEPRFGIGRDAEFHSVREGLFYLTHCYRFASNHGFAVEVDLVESVAPERRAEFEDALARLDGRVVPLGGKRHHASIHVSDAPLLELTRPQKPQGDDQHSQQGEQVQRTKLWLQTPALVGTLADVLTERIETKVTERPVLVGGFDMAKRRPRELRRALPVGTVLWLNDIEQNEAEAALSHAQEENDRRAGYGVALAGRW